MTKTIQVEGMGCAKCVKKVQTALEALEGVESAAVSLEEKTAVVTMTAPVEDAALQAAVESKGFEVAGIA